MRVGLQPLDVLRDSLMPRGLIAVKLEGLGRDRHDLAGEKAVLLRRDRAIEAAGGEARPPPRG